MKKHIKNLLKSKFVKNVTILATGVAGAQVVTMALSPIVTRLYTPEAIGVLGSFTAITRTIIPIAALTYPIAIVLPKRDQEAEGIIKLSIYLSLIIATLVTVIIGGFNSTIVSVLKWEEYSSFIYLIPLVVIFSSFLQVSEQWLIRTNQFVINAKVYFYQSVIINISKVGIGLFYPVAIVLVILQVAEIALRAIMMMIFAKKSKYKIKRISSNDSKVSVKHLAKKYYDFPLYRAPEKFLSSVAQSLPVLLLTGLFGPASAGFYSLGRTALSIPSRLIGDSIGDVFYPRISEAAKNGENVKMLIKRATLALAGLGIIPFGIIILFGPIIFEFVFGAEWDIAGEYARWIALASFSVFINKPSVKSMPVLSAQRFHLFFTVIRLLTRSVSLIIGFFIFNSDLVAVALFGIAELLANLIFIFITLNLSEKKIQT